MGRLTSFARTVLTIAGKDLRIEMRTREIITTAGFFAALVAIMASISFQADQEKTERLAAGGMWLPIAFASVLALSRTWQREREESALTGLLVAPIARGALFLGKAVGIFVFVTAVELVVVPIVALMFHVDLTKGGISLGLAALLALGTVGIAATGTLFGAMTARTRARDLVLASVLFPLLSPTLLSGVAGTRALFEGASFDELRDYFVLLGGFDAIAVAGGLSLFGLLVDD
jgi:heme exporter protein B